MLSMSLGMVADFDERAGDYAAAIRALDAAIATNDACGLRGFTGSLLARLGWVLLHDGDVGARRGRRTSARSTAPAGCSNTPVMFLALTGMAVLHRLHGRNGAAAAAATEALDLYRAGGPRRFRNRVDPQRDLPVAAAACCVGARRDRRRRGDDPEQAATLLGQAERLRADAAGADGPARSSTTTSSRARSAGELPTS